MSGYDGQEENGTYRRISVDGPYIFREGLFRACTSHLRGGSTPNEDTIHELQALATQEPPSHLARGFLDKLGISIRVHLDDYDAIVAEGWKLEANGFGILADVVSQQQGITLAIQGDGG